MKYKISFTEKVEQTKITLTTESMEELAYMVSLLNASSDKMNKFVNSNKTDIWDCKFETNPFIGLFEMWQHLYNKLDKMKFELRIYNTHKQKNAVSSIEEQK